MRPGHAALVILIGLSVAACDNPSPRAARRAPVPLPYDSPAPGLGSTAGATASQFQWDGERSMFLSNGKQVRAEKLWTFAGSTDGFVGLHAEVSPAAGDGLQVDELAPDVLLRSPKGLKIDGGNRSLILVRIRRLSPGKAWDSTIFYATATHGESPDFFARPISGGNPAVGQTVLLVYDMHRLSAGGDDWKMSKIDQIRLDLDDGPGGQLVIEQIAIAQDPGAIDEPR